MKVKFSKAIALLTVMIMTITLLTPMSAAAAGSDTEKAGSADEGMGGPEILNRGKIKILEVYADGLKDKNTENSTKAVYKKLAGNNAYSVTTISINRLISLKDDINGKYDIVYFNKGQYTRNASYTLNRKGDGTEEYNYEYSYGSDITRLTAAKLEEFIKSGQLCVFHNDIFKSSNDAKEKTILKEVFSQYKNNPGKYKNFKTVVDSKTAANYAENVIGKFADLYNDTESGINPRPILQMTDYPAAYNSENTGYVSNKLTFSFKVYDPNTPLDESLKVALYIDRNGDSLFEESEIVYPLGDEGDYYTTEVLNGRSGTITYNMPQGLTGIYFWKLVVRDSQNAKDEFESVFRLKGQTIKVNVLQIKPDINNGGNLSLNDQFYNKTRYGKKDGEYEITITEKKVSEINKMAAEGKLQLNGKYNMVIIGFYDNYTEKKTMEPNYTGALGEAAVKKLREFVDTKQSVMFTHDTIHFQYNQELTKEFAKDVGQVFNDFQGVWTIGLAGSGLSGWDDPGGKAKKARQEFDPQNHYQVVNTWPDFANTVNPVNTSQLTLYPFVLEGGIYNDYRERKVAKTHYQWYKLDLEDPEVIPLYNLYVNGNSKFNDDAMNNYYTYTKGNITFSGTGHSNQYYDEKTRKTIDGYPDFETKLFVNTVIKAYSVANHAPEITIYEPQDNEKIPSTSESINLKFRAYDFDFGNDNLKYEIFIDKQNRGNDSDFVSLTNGNKIDMRNGEVISFTINKADMPDFGKFRIRVYAEDEYEAGSYQTLTLERVDAPMITPQIEILDMDGNPITGCLVNETVKARLNFAVSGKTLQTVTANPAYDLTGEYYNESEIQYITNEPLGQVIFSNGSPQPENITKVHNITIRPLSDGDTSLVLTAKVRKINGLIDEKAASGGVNIRSGQVEICVTDFSGNPIKNAKVKDMNTGTIVGTTNDSGKFVLYDVAGHKDYEIEAPSGYTYTASAQSKEIYRILSDNTKVRENAINLTYDNNRWEVDFKVSFTLGMTIDYYKLNMTRTDMFVIGNANANNTVKNQKNTPITIVAAIDIQPLASGELRKVDFEIETKDKNGNVVNSGDLLAVISSGSGELSGVAALNGYTQMNASNSIASGSYAGNKYYLVIKVNKTDGQVIRIKKATLTSYASNGTQVPRVVDFSGNVTIAEASPPVLR